MIRAPTHEETYFVAKQMSYAPSGDVKGVATIASGKILACILYDSWTINSVQVHVYSTELKALFDPVYLREIFTFPFITGNRRQLIAVTPANQKGSLAVSSWLGFKELSRIPDGWDRGVDMVLKRLLREDCRFLSDHVKSEPCERCG